MEKNKQKTPSGCLKNREEFVFEIDAENKIKTSNQSSFCSALLNVKFFFNGLIYNNSEKSIIEGYTSKGLDYFRTVEGSFVIFIIDGNNFFIVTDKVNSKKAYYGLIHNNWYISNNIDLLPTNDCHFDTQGMANYLANGVMFNDITLFEEIKSAKRASIHQIFNGQLNITKYWDESFNYSLFDKSKKDLYQNELEELIIRCVEERYATVKNPIISLSAGYDSRGILGTLHKKINAEKMSCFSYGSSENLPADTDAKLAEKLATICGYPHHLIKSYEGNLINLINKNAKEGKCIANFCDELDAWHYLAKLDQFSDVFVGEQCLGSVGSGIKSKRDIFDRLHINDSQILMPLESFISKNLFRDLCHKLNNLTDQIYASADKYSILQDKLDYLHLDQKCNHIFMPWREHFSSQVGFVHNPYLDGRILDFRKKLPPDLRDNKLLFKETITRMLPEIFSVGHPSSPSYQMNWHDEFRNHKTELIKFINSTDSRLDSYFSKRDLINILRHEITMNKRNKGLLIWGIIFFRRKYKSADKLLGIFVGPLGKPVKGLDKLLLRLLVMRTYLSTSSLP